MGDKTVGSRTLSGLTARSYAGAVPIRTVVTDLVSDLGEDFRIGPLDAVPNVEVEDWTHSGAISVGLTWLLDPHGVDWYDDDGQIRFNRSGVTQPDAEIVTLNPRTGLIGSPSVTNDGAKARSLLNASLRVGNRVQLDSETLKGQWRIVGVRHHGSTYAGSVYYSDLDLRN